MFYHKAANYNIVHSKNLFENRKKNHIRIFPDFPDPVFFPEKKLRRLAHGQTARQFDHFVIKRF